MASQTQRSSTTSVGWPAGRLAWVGRQLLLVPEAALLLALLCLHTAVGPSPALTALGFGLILWFMARIALLYSARRAVDRAHYEQAEALARWAIRLYPLSADAHALLGTTFLARGNALAASAALASAVRYYPLQASLHAALSAALIESGQLQEAIAAADAALRLDPACAQAYLHQAAAHEQLEAPAELVERHLRAGLALPAAPADEAALSCGLARTLLRRGSQAEARLALARAEGLLSATPPAQRANLHYQIGEVLRTAGDQEAARAHFGASESLDPHGPHAAAAWRAARS
jgi:tetratricopeptide (TPR) repeat protein